MLWLWLTVLAECKWFLFFLLCLHKKCAGGGQEVWKGQSLDSWPQLSKERGRKDIHHYGICLHKESFCMVKPCFPESSKTSTCKWKTGIKLLILLCLCAELLIHLLNFLYPHLLIFILFSSYPMGKEGEGRAVWMLGCWPSSAQRNHTFYTISKRRLILMLV